MSRPNTNYGLRPPSNQEILAAFGSLAGCVRVTGGDLPTILFFLSNRERIKAAGEVDPQPGAYAEELQESARVEQAAAEWEGMEKPTIIGVARSLRVCRPVARRALVAAGKVAR